MRKLVVYKYLVVWMRVVIQVFEFWFYPRLEHPNNCLLRMFVPLHYLQSFAYSTPVYTPCRVGLNSSSSFLGSLYSGSFLGSRPYSLYLPHKVPHRTRFRSSLLLPWRHLTIPQPHPFPSGSVSRSLSRSSASRNVGPVPINPKLDSHYL